MYNIIASFSFIEIELTTSLSRADSARGGLEDRNFIFWILKGCIISYRKDEGNKRGEYINLSIQERRQAKKGKVLKPRILIGLRQDTRTLG